MRHYLPFGIMPAGGHHVETVNADDATAALQLRGKLGLQQHEFEVVAVASAKVTFEQMDGNRLALAPYSAASP